MQGRRRSLSISRPKTRPCWPRSMIHGWPRVITNLTRSSSSRSVRRSTDTIYLEVSLLTLDLLIPASSWHHQAMNAKELDLTEFVGHSIESARFHSDPWDLLVRLARSNLIPHPSLLRSDYLARSSSPPLSPRPSSLPSRLRSDIWSSTPHPRRSAHDPREPV